MYRFKCKKILMIICIITFCVLLSNTCYADELELEKSNINYQEGGSDTIVTNVSEAAIGKYSYNKIPSILDDLIEIRSAYSLQSIGASYSDPYYNIADDKTINIRDQKTTGLCWIIPAMISMEVNMQLSNQVNSIPELSDRHCEYATSRYSFVDGENKYGYDRRAGDGGRPIYAFRYLTNGKGAVLESDMPFEDNSNNISLSDLDKEINQIATGFEILPVINKQYDSQGNVTYYDEVGRPITEEEVKALRNIIKSHIINYGAISTTTYSDSSRPYHYDNTSNIRKAKAYYNDDEDTVANHGVTIIGWDDNYSKDNFNSSHKPAKDGAYIVMDSYGNDIHNNGIYYISYDDILVEYNLIGVTGTSTKDYDNLYQNDFYGASYTVGTKTYDEGYLASVFERDKTQAEYLEYVGISSTNYAQYEIYVNPKGSSLNSSFLVKVAETAELMPGYTRISINPIKLESNHFAIVIKQKSNEGEGFYFPLEIPIPNTPYSYATGTEDASYMSYDGKNWKDIKEVKITNYDMTQADTCIKGYTTKKIEDNTDTTDTTDTTTDPIETVNDTTDTTDTSDITDTIDISDTTEEPYEFSLKTTKYAIHDSYLWKIEPNTSIEVMMESITNNAKTISVLDVNNNAILDSKTIVTTGMTLIFNNEVRYKLVVRGDVNCDGKVTLTDISKLVFHYNEYEEYQLVDAPLKAADMNYDGKISLTDLSQLVFYYSSF